MPGLRARRVEAADGLEPVLEAVRRRTGLTLPPRNAPLVTIRREMRNAGISSAAEYAKLLSVDSEEFDSLVTALTVGETYFLRESKQLEFIRDAVIPGLQSATGGGTLRAWSAGCAQGEEAYSLAITAHAAEAPIRVLGTDISAARLERARAATYREWSFRGVSPEIRAAYFRLAHDGYVVAAAIRERVEFRPLNLAAADWSAADELGPFDLVLCRNTLIYLDARTVARVARRLMAALTPSGWLFLGASDPILSGMVPCEVVLTGSGIAYRRAALSSRHRVAEPATEFLGPSAQAMPPQRAPLPPIPERRAAAAAPARSKRKQSSAALGHDAGARESAADAYADRDYAAAAERARAAVARDPEEAAAWIILIRALANLGRMDEAGRACAAAHDLHRSSAEISYLHGLLLREGGRVDDAAAALRSALYLDRELVIAHLTLGDLLASNGETENAMRSFRNTDRLLARMPADEIVAATDGLRADTLRQLTRGRIDYWQARREDAEAADA